MLNSVLEENAIDFCMGIFCRIFILHFNFLTNGVFVVFPQLCHRRFSPAVQCVLCVLCAKKQVRVFCVFARTMGPVSDHVCRL